MRLIMTKGIEKMAKDIGLTFDDIYNFIQANWIIGFIPLCSPIDGTTAYKGYLDHSKRIIIFEINKKGIIYPVYIGNKNDLIARNITVDIVRKEAEKRHKQVETDIKNKNLKIRHF